MVSLALSLTLWLQGLAGSLERPSVLNSLSLRQLELAALGAETLPEPLRAAVVGGDPRGTLAKELQRQIEATPTTAPVVRRLELVLLKRNGDQRSASDARLRQLVEMVEIARRPLLEALIAARRVPPARQQQLLAPWRAPTLVAQLSCEQLGGPDSACPTALLSGRLRLQLLAVNLLPVLLLIGGLLLLLRQAWRQWRGTLPLPAPLLGPPLSLVDVTLLIAGGFVLLGEVILPLLLQPLVQALLQAWSPAGSLGQGVEVLVLYLGLMAAPLTILWLLLRTHGEPPDGGWLQWRWRPLALTLKPATAMVLMVLPAVALSGWLIELIWGDPGGSNPLLDLVLTSSDPSALACFSFTALVLAPLFEETMFRGVLLPVLGRQLGGAWAVLISAAIFAVAHLSLGELAPLFLLGIGLGWLRWRSGRLAASVFMHALWNGLTFLNLLVLAD